MKAFFTAKPRLASAAFAPVLLGYLLNVALPVPVIGMIFYYMIPLFTLVFWFFIGGRYAHTNWNLLLSVLISHVAGFVSLILYHWQFLLLDDNHRNLFIAGLSQAFTACTCIFTVRIAILFEAESHTFTRTTVTAMQYLGIILMMLVFTFGYLFRKRQNAKANNLNSANGK